MRAALLIAILATPAVADDFRNATFGMTPDEVRATEPTVTWMGKDNLIGFMTDIANLAALAQYQFADGKLYAAGYRIREEHSNRTLYIDDYDKLHDLLIEKYGTPKDDDTIWRNDLYRDDPEDYGMAIAIGHLIKATTWFTTTAEITLMLSGDNYEINLVLLYASRQLQEGAEAADREETLNAL